MPIHHNCGAGLRSYMPQPGDEQPQCPHVPMPVLAGTDTPTQEQCDRTRVYDRVVSFESSRPNRTWRNIALAVATIVRSSLSTVQYRTPEGNLTETP